MADSGYGAGFGPVWRALLRDYRVGAGNRARARLGFLAIEPRRVPMLASNGTVVEHWRRLRGDDQRRSLGDAARRRFWEERRQVDANLGALMDRVWTW